MLTKLYGKKSVEKRTHQQLFFSSHSNNFQITLFVFPTVGLAPMDC